MIKNKNIEEGLMTIWRIVAHFRPTGQMSEMQLQQTAVAFIFLRRIDCLIGRYASECAKFYTNNTEVLSNERLSEKLCEISGGYPFYNYSGYNFSEILLSNNTIEVVMNSYLQGFSDNVQDILNGMAFSQNLAILYRQSRFLVELLEICTNLDLSSSSVDNEEFVEIITSMLGDNSSVNGTVYTSTNLSQLICSCLMSVDVRNDKKDNTTIYDPVCGTGSMLAIAGEMAKSFAIHQDNITLYGQEISVFSSAIAKALVMLGGNKNSKICYGDTLTDDQFKDSHFQYILADMPFGLDWGSVKDRIERESLDENGRFSKGLPSYSDSLFLFIEHIISKMDPNGSRVAFLTPSSALWRGGASSGESRIRRWLFENDMVETIMALPGGTLANTGISVCIWILSNCKKDFQKGKVRLIETSSLMPKMRNHYLLNEKTIKSVVAEYSSSVVSLVSKNVNNEDFGYFEVGLLENGKKKENVIISLDTDIEQYIKRDIQPYSKGVISVDYSSVEKGFSVHFDKYFKAEKDELPSLAYESEGILNAIDHIASIKEEVDEILRSSKNMQDHPLYRVRPLHFAVNVVLGTARPTEVDKNGIPFLSVPYMRGKSEGSELYAVTAKNRCATSNDALIVVKGANSGEVFKGIDGILSSSFAAIRCENESFVAPQYLYYLIKGYERKLMSLATGATIKSLDVNSIRSLKCVIPPIEEQIKIASYLDVVIGKIDNVIKSIHCSDSIFSQYRQTLIENAVRGRLNIF